MKVHPVEMILPTSVALGAIVSLALWLHTGPRGQIEARVPGLDRPAEVSVKPAAKPSPPVAGQPVAGDGVPSDLPGQWPGFRGPDRDGICKEPVPLARSWPAEGPPRLWEVTLGEGYAGPAVSKGRVYVLDYDEQAGADTLRCLSLDDGREIWRNSYPVLLTRNHGLSRTVPAIAGPYVVTMGPRCHLACWDAESGECHWLMDLVLDHGTTVPRWYTGQCPLVDGGRVIVAPCGEALLMAVDLETGKVVWSSPNPRGWTMTHSSIMPMEFAGRRMYVYCGSGGVAGVAADDGSLLWDSTEWPEQFATSPSPVVLPEGRIFLSSGYGNKTGSLMLQLTEDHGRIVAHTLFRLAPAQFNAEHHTPIFRDGYLYGVRKRGGGQLVCLDLEGNQLWDSGADRFGHGPYLFADDLFIAMDNEGVLTLAEATPKGYHRLAQYAVWSDGQDAWGPMAIVGGRLIARDMTRMVCLDLAAKQ